MCLFVSRLRLGFSILIAHCHKKGMSLSPGGGGGGAEEGGGERAVNKVL